MAPLIESSSKNKSHMTRSPHTILSEDGLKRELRWCGNLSFSIIHQKFLKNTGYLTFLIFTNFFWVKFFSPVLKILAKKKLFKESIFNPERF